MRARPVSSCGRARSSRCRSRVAVTAGRRVSLIVPWLLFPAVCAVLALGCGLIVERLARIRVPGTLLLPLGLAAGSVLAGFATLSDATAELAIPATVGVAILGIGLLRTAKRRVDGWAAACATTTFLAFGAPVLASGEATFAGYVKLDDTSTFLAIVDRTLDHGRDVGGLAPSTYEATLDVNLARGYPTGSLLPLGVESRLVGSDPAWTFQPYLSLLAAFLALCLYELAAGVGLSRPWRALVATVAAQAALLYGFAQWGGVKELFAAFLLALTAATVRLVRSGGARAGLVPAVPAAALLGAVSLGAVVWLAPLAVLGVGAALRRPWRSPVLGCLAATAVLSVPAVVAASQFLRDANRASFEDGEELGNLTRALPIGQILGVWPAGDFRSPPVDERAAVALLLACLAAAAWGVVTLARRRVASPLAYIAASVAGAAVVVLLGSPWLAAKALAVASPALLFAGLLGAVTVLLGGRKVEGVVLVTALVGGVAWSNGLAFRDTSLAPRQALRELETIGNRFAGEGPALMTDYQPYGVRHFLRRLDAEGASELRRRPIPLRDGRLLGKAEYADLAAFAPDAVLVYRTLVLRRDLAVSRPPAGYQLAWRGSVLRGLAAPGSDRADGVGRHVDRAFERDDERGSGR